MITKIMVISFAILISIQLRTQPIDLSSLKDLPSHYDGIITIYSHGLADTAKQMIPYQKAHIIEGPAVTFDYPDSVHYRNISVKTPSSITTIEEIELPLLTQGQGLLNDSSAVFDSHNIKRSIKDFYYAMVRGRYGYSSLGQDNDIEHLKKAYDLVTSHFPKAKIFFVGLSRGAVTIDTMRYKYNDMKQVVGVLTDSEFDTMDTVIQNKLNQTKLNRFLSLSKGQSIVEKLFSLFRRDGISPIKAIDNVDLTVPRLIVASKEDTLVPVSCAKTIYNKLKEMGHKKLHIWIADYGSHGKILESADRANYAYIVHAFKKNYGLPYDEMLAQKGEILFGQSQPEYI